jgi:L-fuculose-phosphate aldolase
MGRRADGVRRAGPAAADVAPRGAPDGALRAEVVAAVGRLDATGLNRGSTGNVSARGVHAAGFWITPTGMGAEAQADDLVWMGDDGRVEGAWMPSSEWPFHRAIYRARSDLGAVVHVHSVHATAVACLRKALPAFHYMVAVAGGDDIPCTPYHLFGTDALSAAVAEAFRERHACLMANHGLVAGGRDLAHALKVVQEVEALCEAYLLACAAGDPVLLTREQMAEVIRRFRSYGRARRAGAAR